MWIVIFLCGAVGGTLRHALTLGLSQAGSGRFPLGTLLVNVSGCLAIGLVWGWFAQGDSPSELVRILDRDPMAWIGFGLLGGYTTVSTFAIDTLHLARRRHLVMAVGYLAATWVFGLAGVALGWLVMIR